MKEGTLWGTIRLRTPWPPDNKRIIMEMPKGTVLLRIHGYPDGHLGFEVEENGTIVVQYETQPVVIQGGGMMFMAITWTPSKTEVAIENQILRPWNPEDLTPHVFVAEENVAKGPLSPEHPDAVVQCQHWMNWRTQHLGTPRVAKAGRRLKSADEQIEELRAEIETLRYDAQQVMAGRCFFIRRIAGSLRGLIYWQMQKNGTTLNPSYNPLLLRLAARQNLPLPVFAMPEDSSTRPEIISKAEVHFINNIPTIQQLFRGQVLMDLQEWMNSPISTERFAGLLPGDEKVLVVKELISQVANTLGGTHFDEDVPEQLDRLRDVTVYDLSFVDKFILSVADSVLQLGGFVVK